MDWVVIVCAGILLLGLILFFVLAGRRDYREHSKAVEHFKEARDKIAEVKQEPEEEDNDEPSSGGGFSLGGLISGMISIIIMVAVGFPVLSSVQSTVCESSSNLTMTVSEGLTCMNGQIGGTVGTIFSLLPIFMVLGALIIVLRVFI